MSDDSRQSEQAVEPGHKWGDSISPERQAELQGYLDRWQAGTDHRERKGPFYNVELTGADVYWLAEQSVRDEDGSVPNLHVEGADLSQAQLDGANLDGAHMAGANFYQAQLQGASLREAQLEGADLYQAQLGGAYLYGANFMQADLRKASLDKHTRLDRHTILTNVRLDGAIFDDTNLSEVDWEAVPVLQDEQRARQARYPADYKDVDKRHQLKARTKRKEEYQAAARAYRRLAVALQANGMNDEAAGYAYRAQVMQRRVYRYRGWRARGRWLFSWLLDGLAGYGYRPERSIFWYLCTILSFASAYFVVTHGIALLGVSFQSGLSPLQWYEALVLSISSFHGRGFFQPVQSLGDPVAIIAAAEAIIGLLIEISFIATFTQRFFGR